eukprot:XP_014061848.1 PREDICTED: protein canopy homolog 3-like [Salmo salar]
MIEQYEEVIEDWYKGSQEEDLTTYLCENHVLKGQDTACLKEEYSKKGDVAAIAEEKKKKKKKGVGKKKSKDAGGSDGGSQEGEAARKTVNKKGKAVSPEKEREGVSSDEDIQLKVALPGKNTEL